MVKFVASDLDGTLLLNGAQSIDESAIQYINKLVDKGVIFAPASGRQITSLKRLFGAVSDKLAYIAENGALVEYKGETIGKTAMDRKLALEIIEDVLSSLIVRCLYQENIRHILSLSLKNIITE